MVPTAVALDTLVGIVRGTLSSTLWFVRAGDASRPAFPPGGPTPKPAAAFSYTEQASYAPSLRNGTILQEGACVVAPPPPPVASPSPSPPPAPSPCAQQRVAASRRAQCERHA